MHIFVFGNIEFCLLLLIDDRMGRTVTDWYVMGTGFRQSMMFNIFLILFGIRNSECGIRNSECGIMVLIRLSKQWKGWRHHNIFHSLRLFLLWWSDDCKKITKCFHVEQYIYYIFEEKTALFHFISSNIQRQWRIFSSNLLFMAWPLRACCLSNRFEITLWKSILNKFHMEINFEWIYAHVLISTASLNDI